MDLESKHRLPRKAVAPLPKNESTSQG